MGGCSSVVNGLDSKHCGGCPTFAGCVGVFEPLPDSTEENCLYANSTTNIFCRVERGDFTAQVIVPSATILLLILIGVVYRHSRKTRRPFPGWALFCAAWWIWFSCLWTQSFVLLLVARMDLDRLAYGLALAIQSLVYLLIYCAQVCCVRVSVFKALFPATELAEPLA